MKSPNHPFLVSTMLGAVLGVTCYADAVKLKSGITVSGEILRYDDHGVAIRLPSKQVREYATDQIKSVEAPKHPAHEAADAALGRGEVAKAGRQYQQALDVETRPWAVAQLR